MLILGISMSDADAYTDSAHPVQSRRQVLTDCGATRLSPTEMPGRSLLYMADPRTLPSGWR